MSDIKTWEEIRKEYPDVFVLLTHCQERHKDEKSVVIVAGEVIFTSKNGQDVYERYRQMGMPQDATFGHTSHPKLEIEDIPFMGIHPSF